MPRVEAIRILLLHLADVRAGLWDGRSGGDGLPVMCSAWRHPSFQELERLLLLLRREEPRCWRARSRRSSTRRTARRAWCIHCGHIGPPEQIGVVHQHGRRPVVLVVRMIRVGLYPVADADVERAVDWLEGHWRGGVFVPDELREVTAVA